MEECFPIPAGLSSCLQTEYGLAIRNIVPAERGFYGETWEICTPAGKYFAKLDRWPCHKESYRRQRHRFRAKGHRHPTWPIVLCISRWSARHFRFCARRATGRIRRGRFV